MKQMKTFEQAARDAACAIFNSEKLEVMPTIEASPKVVKNDLTDIITKHFAELAELHSLLVELAKAWRDIKNNSGCSPYSIHAEPLDKAWDEATRLLANPLVAAAIKETK